MRWHILKALLLKEALRHATNRGGLLLAGLLVTASLVMAALNPAGEKTTQLIGGIHHCFIHAEDFDGPFVKHLQESMPPELRKLVFFKKLDPDLGPDQTVVYPTGTGAIQIRKAPPGPDGEPRYLIWVWHPAGDRSGMEIYESWFSREAYRFAHQQAIERLNAKGLDGAKLLPMPDLNRDDLWNNRLVEQQLQAQVRLQGGTLPEIEWRESPLVGPALDMHAAINTALVMFSLFFTCVYLMPALTCEERERGLLLAQVLSPARVREILASKFFFYPTFGIFLATLLAGIQNPAVLLKPFFWLAIISLAMGSLGIGMSIASLARTQRSASLGALCYMLVVAMVLLICQQNNITWIPYLTLEYHAPQILHAVLTNQTREYHWFNLLGCTVLAIAWVFAAGFLFRKRGWQ